MEPIDIVACSACGLLILATIVTLKLALRRKQNAQPLLPSIHHQAEVTCWENFKFLILRFTLLELFAVRVAHLKLNWLLTLAVIAVVSLSLEKCYYWGWAVATITGMLVFLLAELKIFKDEMDQQIVEIENSRRLRWRRPLLYGVYALLSVMGFSYVAWSFVYIAIQAKLFGFNLGAMILADQLVGRTALSFVLSFATKDWTPMIELRARYFEYERPLEAAVGDEKLKEGAAPASPSKKRTTFPSPSKIPRAISKAHSIEESICQSKIENRPYEMDSLVNFLQMSQQKRICKAKLPPMHSASSTPTHKLRNGFSYNQSQMEIIDACQNHNKFDTPIRLVKRRESNQMLMSDIEKVIDDRVDRADQDIHELQGKDLNTKSRANSIVREQDTSSILERQGADMRELEVYNHQTIQRSRILVDVNKDSRDSRLKSRNESELDQLNTVELCSKQSLRNKPSESPRDIIPKCHGQDENVYDEDHKRRVWMGSSNKRSIENIEEEVEEEEPRSNQFYIIENPGEFEDDDVPDRQNRARTLDPAIRLQIRPSKHEEIMGHRNSVLEIREDDVQQLEEVDLNSPIKRKEISPDKVKESITVSGKQKKKRNRKRDIRDLRKLNSGSPYLEYLPNMLNKETEQKDKDKRASLRQVGRQLLKENPDNMRRGAVSTRKINPQPSPQFYINELNNQNRCPDDIVEDF